MTTQLEIFKYLGVTEQSENLKGESYDRTLQLVQRTVLDKGWSAIEGRIGVGKTTTTYQAISEVSKMYDLEIVEIKIPDRKGIKTQHILNAFIRTLGEKYDGDKSARMRLDARTVQVERILMKMKDRGVTAMLVIDEAHELQLSTLNVIKRLRDVSFMHKAVMLPVLFLGQPGLFSLLERNDEVSRRVKRKNRLSFEPTRKELIELILYKTQGLLEPNLAEYVLDSYTKVDRTQKILPTALELEDFIEEAMENAYNIEQTSLTISHFRFPVKGTVAPKIERKVPVIEHGGAQDVEDEIGRRASA